MTLAARLRVYLVLAHAAAGAAGVLYAPGPAAVLVVEVALALSLLVGLRYASAAALPATLVRAGADQLAERDFATRFCPVGYPDVDALVALYNRLADGLRDERVRQQEQNWFLEKVLEASPSGIVTMDFDGRVASANPAAERLLGVAARDAIGRAAAELPSALAPLLATVEIGSSAVVALSDASRVRCRAGEFVDRGFARRFLVLDEVTDELRRSERAAYETLIRMIAHEVNNSLGAVGSILSSCRFYAARLDDEERGELEGAIDVALGRADSLASFVRAFAEVVRLPDPRPEPGDPVALLERVARLFAAACESAQIDVRWDLRASPREVPFDPVLMEQVFVNAFKNAIEAVGERGTITVRSERAGERLALTIEDTGPGLSDEARANLFVPFFTTKERGQGIGLTIAREVLARHGFDVSLDAPAGGPTRFTVTM